jgi:glucose-6-phosphate isomerase
MKSTEHHILSNTDSLQEKVTPYVDEVVSIASDKDYTRHESALAIASDKKYYEKVCSDIEHLVGVKLVVLVGIGGSSLGVEAIYAALAHEKSPRLIVLDAIDTDAFLEVKKQIDATERQEDIAVVVVSKSGATTETMVNATLVLNACEKKFGATFNTQVVFVGSEGSAFFEAGRQQGITCVSFPESIGGRYSVFSAVGTVPLVLLGVDVAALHEGAMKALEKDSRDDTSKHAATLAVLAKEGVHTVTLFAFDERLRLLGYWYRQLLAESIGKNETKVGTTFSRQLLPTVASSVDLHSMAQLYLGGYKNMFTHFLYDERDATGEALGSHWLLEHMKTVAGHTPDEVQRAIREGVLKAYDDQKLPYRLTACSVTAHEIGHIMASLMLETMCVGRLLEIDVFNQPNVESYKKHTRDILGI